MYAMNLKYLENCGLTDSESKIYLALVDKGASTAGEIAKITKIHRRNVYDSMERLIEKGLIGAMYRNKKKHYLAVNPQRLVEIMDEQQDSIKEILPHLESKMEKEQEQGMVSFFQGKIGLKQVLRDQINTGKEVLIMGGSGRAVDILGPFIERYDRERKQKKIPAKILFNEDTKGNYPKKIPLSEIRYLDKRYTTPAASNIYGDKVALITWSENPLIILIENKEIADSYRKNFELLWSISKE